MKEQTTDLVSVITPAATDEGAKPLPEELIELPGGRWALWRCVGVRGTGFPISQVLRLSSPECGAAADRVAAAEESAKRARATQRRQGAKNADA